MAHRGKAYFWGGAETIGGQRSVTPKVVVQVR